MIRLKSLLLESSKQEWADSVNIISKDFQSFTGKVEMKYSKISGPRVGLVAKYFGKYTIANKSGTPGGGNNQVTVPAGEGIKILLNTDGSVQKTLTGTFYNGKLHDKNAKIKYSNGSHFEGSVLNDIFSGNGIYYNVNNVKCSGYWKNNELIGDNGKTFNFEALDKFKYTADFIKAIGFPGKPEVNATSNNEWFRHPSDNVYVYQQRQGVWWAKNINNNKEFDISKNPAYKSTIDNLNSAQQTKKLVKV